MKKIFLILFCLIITYPVCAQGLEKQNEVTFKLGKTLYGSANIDININGVKESVSKNSSDGISAKMEYIYYLKNYTGVGVGMNYNFGIKYYDEDFSALNYYLMAKQMLPLDIFGYYNIYVSAGIGYGLVDTSYVREGYTQNLKGGIYWTASLGFEYKQFVFEASLTSNKIDISATNADLSGDVTSLNGIFSVGYKFII